jgi:hypothetical protein
MNIFALDLNPSLASRYHTDKHVVKMPLETAQMLCTASYLSGSPQKYKPAFINHPCNIWARKSLDNYYWLCELGLYLCDEYKYRYNREHACKSVIKECYNNIPAILSIGLTPHELAMPDDCKMNDAVNSYHAYYNNYKRHLFSWTKRNTPEFIVTKFCNLGQDR